ncbi:MAG: LytTR family DNA-binding domain-containing protein [Bacteroidetes bacterium]|nr:LytTR family DNA-binding domain-containing protein [Bacteroidota bacterium]
MIRILIIENETAPAEILKAQLENNFPDVVLLDVCDTVESSISSINKYLPDLVFLDVELNHNENGFEILKRLNKFDFEIIVTTAYDKYAIQACRASVVDFLIKPVAIDELIAAIEKYKKRISRAINPKQIELLLSIYQNSSLSLSSFALPTMTGFITVEKNNILYFKGAGNQTYVYFTDNSKECINALLRECEKLLSNSNFCRIHKSFLINLNQVKEYFKGKDGLVVMRNNDQLTVSRDYKDEFLSRFRSR